VNERRIDSETVNQEERRLLGLESEQPVALSISGGGIRSATFALGALQALAARGVLGQLDYLSTVSGGGYIGGWLTAWIHRRGSVEDVAAELNRSDKEAPEIGHLRAYSNYLTPKLGLMSFDSWALLTTVLRNMLLNWMVLIPLLMCILMLPRMYASSLTFPEFYFYCEIVNAADCTVDEASPETVTPARDPSAASAVAAQVETAVENGIPSSDLQPTVVTEQSDTSPEIGTPLSGSSANPAVPEQGARESVLRTDYSIGEMNLVADNIGVGFFLPVLSLGLFSIALAHILRYLPGVGNVQHRSRQYFLWIILPMLMAIWFLDMWNNLFFTGSRLLSPSPMLYATGGVIMAGSALLQLLVLNPRYFLERAKLQIIICAAFGLAAIPALVAWLVFNKILWNDDPTDPGMRWYWAQYTSYSLPLILVGIAIGVLVFVGLTVRILSDADREWLARANGGLLLIGVGWLVFSFAALVVPIMLLEFAARMESSNFSVFGSVGALGGAFGWLASALGTRSGSNEGNMLRRVLAAAGVLVTVTFVLLLLVLLSLLTNMILILAHKFYLLVPHDYLGTFFEDFVWSNPLLIVGSSSPWIVLVVALLLLLMSRAAAWMINVNTFSLQGMYRNRLIRAYLGASRTCRTPNAFTGFDEQDDLRFGDIDASQKPFHVVNMALNLVSGGRLDWQERKASSFVATPLYCGNDQLGYRSSQSYGGGITLGTAVATSGAAVSPSMGYHSSPLATFVMTLFNARLGIWLGNPMHGRASRSPGPQTSFLAFFSEFFGLTSDDSEYVYLSDGGHFENLALYQMLARKCRRIIVLDGGCDPTLSLSDLGNAMRKAKVDLNVDIEFLPGHVENLLAKNKRCALAEIQYANEGSDSVMTGQLIYIKPMVCGDESPAVLSYHADNPTFPHESTGDQWFSESQTESYRQLGYDTVDQILADYSNDGTDLFDHIDQNYLSSAE
jgi:hypothetical protein